MTYSKEAVHVNDYREGFRAIKQKQIFLPQVLHPAIHPLHIHRIYEFRFCLPDIKNPEADLPDWCLFRDVRQKGIDFRIAHVRTVQIIPCAFRKIG